MKILIADDDRQIRTGLSEGIDWSELGIDTVLTAADGNEALRLFCQYSPEIILTDIRMPGLDGLELSREIRKQSQRSHIIVLSGYSDFEYARQAMRFNVQDYLLKPVRIPELLQVVEEARDRILQTLQQNEEQNLHARVFQEKFLDDLASGQMSDAGQIADRLEKFWQISPQTMVRVAMTEIDQSWRMPAFKDRSDFLDQVEVDLPELIHGQPIISIHRDHHLITLLHAGAGQIMEPSAGHPAQQIRPFQDHSGETYTITIGISHAGPASMIHDCYQQAEQALRQKLFAGNGHILYASREACQHQAAELDGRAIQLLTKAIQDFDAQTARDLIRSTFASLRSSRCTDRESVDRLCSELKDKLVDSIKSQGFDFDGLFAHNISLFEQPGSWETLDEFETWLSDFYEIVLMGLSEMKGARTNIAARKAAEFIQLNFSRDITLEEVAEAVQKSPNYFSHLFKKIIGVSFSEYLNRIRVQEAKKLLRTTGLMAYEIAEKVGFQDYKYFNQVFRKLEGCSPSEYRKGKQHD
jgi:two-component system response regulator YesN